MGEAFSLSEWSDREEGESLMSHCRSRFSGSSVAAVSFLAVAAVTRNADAQIPVHQYWVNDGLDGVHQPTLAEVSPDLGGFIPFSAYANPSHYYNPWSGPNSLKTDFYKGILDLSWFNSQIPTHAPGKSTIYPLSASAAFLETTPTGPILKNTWWSTSGGTRRVFLWPYRANGAPVMIAIREDPPNSGLLGLNSSPEVMFSQDGAHHTDFGVNQNRIIAGPWGPGEFETPEAGWPGTLGAPNLSPEDQALEAGDIVVFVLENQSDGLMCVIQRGQDANWVLRSLFAAAPPNPAGGSFAPITQIGRSFLHGGSWGALMSGAMALLQPKLYGGSIGIVSVPDISYGLRDMLEFQNFFQASIGGLPMFRPTDTRYAQWYNLVDLLDCRFDKPGGGWDVAAISANRRSGLQGPQIPATGWLGDEDPIFAYSWHWHQRNQSLVDPDLLQTGRKNTEHGAARGVKTGFNEYAVNTGNEWANIKSSSGPIANNVDFIPPTSAPGTPPGKIDSVFPNPYSHTLRHDGSHSEAPATAIGFLTEDDLSAAVQPSFELPGLPSGGARVKRIGQGVWPAYGDNMRVGDVDGDGKVEVVFGNLDGYIHVLQFDPTIDPSDPY